MLEPSWMMTCFWRPWTRAAALVGAYDVAGVQPAVGDRRGGGVGIARVADHVAGDSEGIVVLKTFGKGLPKPFESLSRHLGLARP
jgi:hypothetical protein